jgi:hypothetical protein
MKRQTPESAVLAEVLQCLANRRILCFRMNVGAHKVGSRFIRYGVKGMADVLAFPNIGALKELPEEILETLLDRHGQNLLVKRLLRSGKPQPLWIEAKANTRQSADQAIFQQVVEADGHWYLVAHSYEEVEAFLKEKKIQ